MVLVVNGTAPPGPVMLLSVPAADCRGTIACRPFAPLARAIVKLKAFAFQTIDPNDEPLRPSSQVNICRLDTIGTPRAEGGVHDGIGLRDLRQIGMRIDGVRAVVSLGADRPVEQGVDGERVGLP